MTTAKISRVTFEVANIDQAATFYSTLLADPGKRHPGARHYFDCGGVTLAILDTSAGGAPLMPSPKSLSFVVDDLDAVHARAKTLGALATFMVHGAPAGDSVKRPWGEKSFYVTDPWRNELCFVAEGTPYT